jgi:DNA-binding transcriptional ArsR family regulator
MLTGRAARSQAPPASSWTFLTNHAHVLLCLAAEPDVRLREVAEAVGITERAVQHIVSDLEAAGVVERTREGRRNRYTVHAELPLRHPIEAHRQVADLVALAPLGRFAPRIGEPAGDVAAEVVADRGAARERRPRPMRPLARA